MGWLSARSHGVILIGLGIAFFAAHVPFVDRTPGSIDAVNFSLGVRDFDLADHQPHPPGYPIFILLGKISHRVLEAVAPVGAPTDNARALAAWSVLFGALAPAVLLAFFREVGGDSRLAVAATVLTVTCPLVWIYGARPMSDLPGLVVALTGQALMAASLRRRERDPSAGLSPLIAGALVSGVAMGIRVQTAWLTVPLLGWVTYRVHSSRRDLTRVTGAFLLGILVWVLPLLMATGASEYLEVFRAQGQNDWTGADILATDPSLQHLAISLVHTLAYPWAHPTLAAATLALTLAGGAVMLARTRGPLAVLALATLPYTAFHLMFQESSHVRYALPVVPFVAYLAVYGAHRLAIRAMPWLVAGLAIAGVVLAFPPVVASARNWSPAYQALDDLRRVAGEAPADRVIAMHHNLWMMLRGEPLPASALALRQGYEWLALVEHWRAQPDVPVWFLADRTRADLALLDSRSRRLLKGYDWTFRRKFLMSREPPDGLDWYELAPPGWIAAEGWSLTHETAGIAARDGHAPSTRPIVAYVRRRQSGAIVMVGGRVLTGDPTATTIALSLDGRRLDSFRVPTGRFFLRTIELAPATLDRGGAYVPLEIRATTDSAAPADVAIEQFDVQPVGSLVYGFDAGWYEPEYDGAAPQPWRWTSSVAHTRIHHVGRDLELHLVAEISKYLDGVPLVTLRAGDRVIARVKPTGPRLEMRQRIPAPALAEAGGMLTLETDRGFVPDQKLGTGDTRHVSLRVYEFQLREVSSPVAMR